jgi:hypothetical protein
MLLSMLRSRQFLYRCYVEASRCFLLDLTCLGSTVMASCVPGMQADQSGALLQPAHNLPVQCLRVVFHYHHYTLH